MKHKCESCHQEFEEKEFNIQMELCNDCCWEMYGLDIMIEQQRESEY